MEIFYPSRVLIPLMLTCLGYPSYRTVSPTSDYHPSTDLEETDSEHPKVRRDHLPEFNVGRLPY